MLRSIKIWHSAIFIWFILLIIRVDQILNFFIKVIPENNYYAAGGEFPGEIILFILLPLLIFIFRKRLFLRAEIKFYNFIGILLLNMFLFPEIICGTDPDFRKDLSVTKLLPPLSKVSVLHIKGSDNFNGENIIFADSICHYEGWVYFQKQQLFEISESKFRFEHGIPEVSKKIFILGSDILGRDVLSRIIFGLRTSLLIAIGAALISFIIGVIAGFIAGYYEAFIGILFSRAVDVLLSFPVIILIILIVALFGNSLMALILILGFTGWMGLFKIVRSEVIILKNKDYFITSRLLGLNSIQLITKEALPVFIIPALTNLVFQINNIIIAESSLSYLGLGVENIYPSWGAMIQSGQEYMNSAWWLMFFPSLMIIITIQSFKGFGNKINSYFNPGLVND